MNRDSYFTNAGSTAVFTVLRNAFHSHGKPKAVELQVGIKMADRNRTASRETSGLMDSKGLPNGTSMPSEHAIRDFARKYISLVH
jgi:hypothetical protein